MFTQLKPILSTSMLVITAALIAGSDNIRLTVTPNAIKKKGEKDDANEPSVLNTPLVITGTAEEIDAELGETLTRYTATRITGAQAIGDLEKLFDAEKTAADKRVKDEQKKGTTTTKPAAAAKAPASTAAADTAAADRLAKLLAAKRPAPEETKAQPALF